MLMHVPPCPAEIFNADACNVNVNVINVNVTALPVEIINADACAALPFP